MAESEDVKKERARIIKLVIKMWNDREMDKSLGVWDVNKLLGKLGSKRELEEP